MSRPKVVVAVTFPFYPPRGGGRLRVFHLYRLLAEVADVVVVCLAPAGTMPGDREVRPGLREVRVPQTMRHAVTEREIEEEAGLPVTDVVFAELAHLTPDWQRTLDRHAADADLLVACHPYVHPSLRAANPAAPLWYEAQDVEVDLKGLTLPDSPVKERLLDAVRTVEADCCADSELVLVCSPADGELMVAEHGVPQATVRLVPNGVDVGAVEYVPVTRRRAHKAALGLGDEARALFLASWHAPNIAAAVHLTELAARHPTLRLWLCGSVCDALDDADVTLPLNVEPFGVVEDMQKDTLLALCDVALNPVETGSGTNLKMFEYLACGAPIVTTTRGARGVQAPAGPALVVADVDDFAEAIAQVQAADPAALEEHTSALRAHVRHRYDWQAIVDDLLEDDVARRRLRLPATSPS